jgi:hypothetical protein
MVALADEGVYRAKDQGRNRVAICDGAEDLIHSTRHVPPTSSQRLRP